MTSPVTIYQSSKGPRVIAEMPWQYLVNAIAALEHNAGLPGPASVDRLDELAALRARKAVLDAEFQAQQEAGSDG